MHIDHKQLLELLADTSGIAPEKVEKQIKELSNEISQAISDGEAYEIEGFGIFSGIGNRVLFIPSKELETEINFKYVGMEPIELEADQVKKKEEPENVDDPFEGLQLDDITKDKKRDPFAGLIDDLEDEADTSPDDIGESTAEDVIIFGVESEKSLEEGETPGPEQWGIEAHKEGSEGVDKLFSHLIGEDTEDNVQEEKTKDSDALTIDTDDDFENIFGEEDSVEETEDENSISSLDAELSSLMSDEAESQPVEALETGLLDDDLEDVFAELEEEPDEEPEIHEEPEPVEEEAIEVAEPVLDETEEEGEDKSVNEPEPEEEVEEIDLDDFDDPFDNLDEDDDDEAETASATDEVIPVITNISSELETPAKKVPEKKTKQPKKKKQAQPVAAWLWMVLGLVIIIGATLGLAYFKIIDIPGITPQVASTSTPAVATTPPPQPPVEDTTPQDSNEQAATQQEETPPETTTPITQPEEQEAQPEVPVQINTGIIPSDQPVYGLNGVSNDAANDGFTIVIYSLSIEQNAFAKQQELSDEGFRALVTPISSDRYGTLWRVSIGQFETLVDAAIAGEGLQGKYKGNYFIKKITN